MRELPKDIFNFFCELKLFLKSIEDFSSINVKNEFENVATKLNMKSGPLKHWFRVILTGMDSGTALFESVELLGKKEVLTRLSWGTDMFVDPKENVIFKSKLGN